MSENGIVFFAYEGGHAENIDSINTGIKAYNSHQSSLRAITWQTLNISGKILNAAVLKAIDDCAVFACDLTYLNHNVLFEFGYAIGMGKELLVLLNPNINGAKEAYENSRIMRNIGYHPFSNGTDVLRSLQQHRFERDVSITSLIEARIDECNTMDLLYLESPVQTQASLDVKSYLTSAEGQIIINDTTEVEYQTLSWYVSSLVKAKSVIIHLLGEETQDRDLYNGEYSFYAGVAAGLGKSVVLVAPSPFRAPIDYGDILIDYESGYDCVAKIAGWFSNTLDKNERKQDIESSNDKTLKRQTNLLHLGIGYEMAEEEEDLLSYFIEVETYRNVLRRGTTIITGRKGSGKSAIFIKLKDDLNVIDGNSISVVLRPESDDLLADVELARLYESVSSRQALLTSVWRYVILSRLLADLAGRIEVLPAFSPLSDSIEAKVVNYVKEHDTEIRDGHFSFIARLFRSLDEIHGFGNQNALESLYEKYIGPIQHLLQEYFADHKYTEISILADNLDKTWDAQYGLDLQADMILSLLSFNDRLTEELRNETIKPHTVIFLRNDIFEYVLDRAREPDKLVAKKTEVDWHRFPEKLKEMIEARFRYSLHRPQDAAVDDVWDQYFNLRRRIHPFEALRKVIVSRPRDYIFFLSKMFESAINHSKSASEDDDFDYALEAYSNYLYRNMIAETQARFPKIVNILKEVQKRSQSGVMDFREFERLLLEFGLSESQSFDLIRFLYEKEFVYAYNTQSGKVLASYIDLEKARNERRFILFRRNKISIQILPNRNRLVGKLSATIAVAGA
ncbi:MAG: hypothetical protein HN368_03160 [Spirochaetales bacterium]|jgi:hypothetical protein|nr:hypothetical protein [Spirochaetales bacterium]